MNPQDLIPTEYYVVYKPDKKLNFRSEPMLFDDLLDKIMMQEDGDLANYEIWIQTL